MGFKVSQKCELQFLPGEINIHLAYCAKMSKNCADISDSRAYFDGPNPNMVVTLVSVAGGQVQQNGRIYLSSPRCHSVVVR